MIKYIYVMTFTLKGSSGHLTSTNSFNSHTTMKRLHEAGIIIIPTWLMRTQSRSARTLAHTAGDRDEVQSQTFRLPHPQAYPPACQPPGAGGHPVTTKHPPANQGDNGRTREHRIVLEVKRGPELA